MRKTEIISVTAIVRNGDMLTASARRKRWDGLDMNLYRVMKVFPNTPKPPYKVTYTLDPKGKYLVHSKREIYPFLTLKSGDEIRGVEEGFFVCFLYSSWDGKTVSREVEKIRAVR